MENKIISQDYYLVQKAKETLSEICNQNDEENTLFDNLFEYDSLEELKELKNKGITLDYALDVLENIASSVDDEYYLIVKDKDVNEANFYTHKCICSVCESFEELKNCDDYDEEVCECEEILYIGVISLENAKDCIENELDFELQKREDM